MELDTSSAVNEPAGSGDSSSGNQFVPPNPPTGKKKRNLPGMPDPDAEVITLSPKTLLATNRFVCEICNKGFQRDQNLQLHRRGHNLPWKLRQRSSKEIRKRVYVCPEPSCVHHDPSRALGDLTGIKKHFCRKHGEKKWKCEKCSKKYAVQSDWKAHLKVCGTREYKCDCGTLFSRRDSFITHRAFCDALAEETAKVPPPVVADEDSQLHKEASPPHMSPPALSPAAADVGSSVLPSQSPELPENPNPSPTLDEPQGLPNIASTISSPNSSSSNGNMTSSVFASLFASSTPPASLQQPPSNLGFMELIQSVARAERRPELEPISLCLATNHGRSIFAQDRMQYAPPSQPALSATALLQKAAQMGATATNGSLLRGLGIESSSSSSSSSQLEWDQRVMELDGGGGSISAGLGLGLACDGGSGLKELMMGTPSVIGPKQATLDLFGLGMAAHGGSNGGFSTLMTSISGGPTSFGGGEFPGKDIG